MSPTDPSFSIEQDARRDAAGGQCERGGDEARRKAGAPAPVWLMARLADVLVDLESCIEPALFLRGQWRDDGFAGLSRPGHAPSAASWPGGARSSFEAAIAVRAVGSRFSRSRGPVRGARLTIASDRRASETHRRRQGPRARPDRWGQGRLVTATGASVARRAPGMTALSTATSAPRISAERAPCLTVRRRPPSRTAGESRRLVGASDDSGGEHRDGVHALRRSARRRPAATPEAYPSSRRSRNPLSAASIVTGSSP